ncbi:Shedu anti-phage system protein SduA domain-containing protein [Gimesia chilikensis]|uniref:Shedu protein SduA C-terminal domain-containing protein n=1 Tax=Gimesia chilikensis TaxID=2605989 RepID=A0A517PMD8_9PLAN|nr:Shedu anti-phage system protein SduA domain-containing protein [Gimesia chilikensis]QDT20529.1 hypothetical protein HG66A1_23150 [Gimesia chilikensis]
MSLPPESNLDDVKVRIRNSIKNPNLGSIQQAVLKEGPQAFRIATLMEILNPNTEELHHYILKLDSIDRKKDGWFYKPEKSITLNGENPNEIELLFRFLQAHHEGRLSGSTGELRILKSRDYEKLGDLIELVPDLASPDMIELIKLIVPRIRDTNSYREEFVEVFEQSDPQIVEHIAVAAQLVKNQKAFELLTRLVESEDTDEQKYQELLVKNPWMFGSEYSELLDRRKWTRDDNLDFMLRRTTDNYLEIVEIKTPFTDALFRYDKSHDSYYPSSNLSKVLGQVMRYITEVERKRDSILAQDSFDTLKIRARIFIGRDGGSTQLEALRNFNDHLHGIEVLTFDQLIRIADRVLKIFQRESFGENGADELSQDQGPF